MNFSREPVALHPTCCVHCISKQTVTRHLQPDHSSHNTTTVDTNTYLIKSTKRTTTNRYNRDRTISRTQTQAHISVADTGLPRWGYQPLSLGKNLLFDKIFSANCIKMKEIGPRGRCIKIPSAPLGSAGVFGTVYQSVKSQNNVISALTFVLVRHCYNGVLANVIVIQVHF